ncbi:MAG: DUF4926 domain-containing protein [Chloroflexota bacterium]
MKPYDVVALTVDLLDKNLKKGQVGTIIEQLEDEVFEVEFSDLNGVTYAMLALEAEQLMILHYEQIVTP